MRSTLRKSGSLIDEKRNARDFGQLFDFTFKQDSDPLSMDSVIEQLGSQFDLTGMEDEIDYSIEKRPVKPNANAYQRVYS